MDNFLIEVSKNDAHIYCAMFLDGTCIELMASNYADALTEADNIELPEMA